MLRVRRPVLAGVLVGVLGGVALVAGCSGPEAAPVPGPAAGTASAPSLASSAPVPSTASAPARSTTPSAPARTASAAAPSPSATGTGSARPDPPAAGDARVEPRRAVVTAAPKKLDEPTRTAGAVVSLTSVRATTITATGPGDRSGPGVLVRLRIVNPTGRPLGTGFVQVGVTGPAGTSGTLVDGPPTDRVGAAVPAGRSAEGTYAFLMDDASTGALTVSVSVRSGQPVVTFRGRAG